MYHFGKLRMYHFGKLRMYTSADYRLAKSKAQAITSSIALTSSVAITPERSQTAITSKVELAKLKPESVISVMMMTIYIFEQIF